MGDQNQSEIAGRKAQTLSIFIFNHFQKGLIRLPKVYAELHNDYNSGTDMYLAIDGVLKYKARYDGSKCRLVGIDMLFKEFNIQWFNPIVLKFVGRNIFNIEIFTPCGIALKAAPSKMDVIDLTSNMKANVEAETKELSFAAKVMRNNRAMGLSRLCLYSTGTKHLHMTMESKHLIEESACLDMLNEWYAESKFPEKEKNVVLHIGQFDFFIDLKNSNGRCSFQKGWREFIVESGITVGEILVLRPELGCIDIQGCVISRTEMKLKEQCGGCQESVKFFCVLNSWCLQKGIIGIPFLLAEKFGTLKEDCLKCRLPNRSIIDVNFECGQCAIVGFSEFFDETKAEIDDVIFVNLDPRSGLEVEFYLRNGIGFVHKTDSDILLESSVSTKIAELMQIASDKACGVEQSEVKTHHAYEKVAVDTVRVYGVGNTEMTTGQEDEMELDIGRDTARTFEVLLLPSHVDQKTHGVYVSKELSDVYKRWGSKTLAKVSDGESTWDIRLNINGNKCRFGSGWNEFVNGAGLKTGYTLKFTLSNGTEKNFFVEIQK